MDRLVPQQVGEDRFSYHQGNDDVQPPAMVNWDRQSNDCYRSANNCRQVGNITINGNVYIGERQATYTEAYRELAPQSRVMMEDMQPWTRQTPDNIQPRQVGRVGYQTVGYNSDVEVYGPRTGVVIRDQRYGYPDYGYRDSGDDALRALQIIGGVVGIAGVARDIFDYRGYRHHRGGGYYNNYNNYNNYQNYEWQQYRQQQNWYYQQQMQNRRYQSNCFPRFCR